MSILSEKNPAHTQSIMGRIRDKDLNPHPMAAQEITTQNEK
jgi:hypothetical protein